MLYRRKAPKEANSCCGYSRINDRGAWQAELKRLSEEKLGEGDDSAGEEGGSHGDRPAAGGFAWRVAISVTLLV